MSTTQMKCGNCDLIKPYDELPKAKDLFLRLYLGEPFTDVECPDCGCLCHMFEEPSMTQEELESIRKVAKEHIGNTNEIEIDPLTPDDISEAENGMWVRAWIWLGDEDGDDKGSDDEEDFEEQE